MTARTLYVTWDSETDNCYRFEVETKRGKRRVYPCGKYQKQTMPVSLELNAMFKRLGVTHVVSKFDNDMDSPECIKDGKYTRTAYLLWWSVLEQESE